MLVLATQVIVGLLVQVDAGVVVFRVAGNVAMLVRDEFEVCEPHKVAANKSVYAAKVGAVVVTAHETAAI